MSRIFIAATDDDVAAMGRILEGRHELFVVSTMAEALKKLKEQAFDLIMVGVHFNESRMFELLRDVYKTPEYSDTPVICFCTRDTPLTRTMHESIDVATRSLGAWMYLDQHEFNVSKDPDAEMRRIVERCLTDEARKKTQASRVDIHKRREELLRLRQALEDKEWSLDVEDRVANLRQKLSEVLLELSKAQIDSIEQQETIAESKHLEDRVSVPVKLNENGMGREERQMERQESEQLAKEQEIIPKEEEKGKEGRRKLAGDEDKE